VQAPGGERYTGIRITGNALQQIIEGGAEVREVPREEALRAAAARGVALDEVPAEAWGKPWFIVKGGVGLPNLVNAEIEVYVHPNWTVAAGYGAGLLPSVFSASVRWRPDATCWGC